MSSPVVLVSGDRKWDNIEVVYHALAQYEKDVTIIHGDCRGLDRIAHVCAIDLGFTSIRCPAHWKHNTVDWVNVYGKCPTDCKEVVGNAAGVLRNRYMLKTHKPDIVLGFHDNISNSRGTKDMLTIAVEKGVPTYLYNSNGEKKVYSIFRSPFEAVFVFED